MTTHLIQWAKEFRTAFECSDLLDDKNIRRQRHLILEEMEELREAEFNMIASGFQADETAQFLKESADIIYVIAQYCAMLGVDLDEAYRRVHENNMSKVGPDGTVTRREDGKVLKPANYRPVDLTDLV